MIKTDLNAGVRAQIEVKLIGMTYVRVYNGACRNVATVSLPVFDVPAKQPGVVTFLNHDESDAGLVADLEIGAGGTDGTQFTCSSNLFVVCWI